MSPDPEGPSSGESVCLSCGVMVADTPASGACPECGQTLMKREARSRLRIAHPAPAARSGSLPPEVEEASRKPENTFARKYILIRKIGTGGMGWVWKAWESPLARFVAIKFLKVPSGEDVLRFEREARLAASLGHPNIIPVYDFGRAQSQYYLVMKYLDGQPLDTLRLEESDLVKLMIPVCEAVQHAHQMDVIHRDLKPQNIMLTTEGWPYVLDFGLAKNVEGSAAVSVSGMVMGTPQYMPPEQAMGQRDQIDRRSDVYSLGATLYFMVTQHPPFEANGPMEVLMKVVKEEVEAPRRKNAAVSAPMEAIILKCLEKDPARRYPAVADLADDLRRLASGETVAARPPRRRWIPRLIRQNPVVSSSLAIAALAIAAAVYFPGIAPSDPAAAKRKEWWDQFQTVCSDFKLGEPPKDALVALLVRAPRELGTATGDLVTWFRNQAARGEPSLEAIENEDRSSWPGRREDARRLAQWARKMQSILQGLPEEFTAAGGSFDKLAGRAERIVAFPGMITLRINVFPFAALQSMKTGDRWFIKDGKILDPGFGTIVGTTLWSPLVIQRFEIADYDLELVHPELGVRKVSLHKDLMTWNQEYRLEGDMNADKRLTLSRQEP